MELRQLEYFVAVVEDESFTRAAARLHVAQPGISAQIRLLERELGQELLERSHRGARLSTFGAAVLPYARAALGEITNMRELADQHKKLVQGHVAVGTVKSCPAVNLPAMVGSFHARFPGVSVKHVEGTSVELIAAVRDGSVDLAAVGLADKTVDDVQVQLVVVDRLVAAVDPAHELAHCDRVTLSTLEQHDLITLPRGSGMRTAIERAFAGADLALRVNFEADDPVVVCKLARQNLGVAVVPRSVARAYGEDLAVRPIVEPPVWQYLALVWRRHGPISRAAMALIDHATQELPSLPTTRSASRDRA